MNRRVIGRIISISHNNVVAELYNNLGNYVTLYDGIRFVGEIGSYVAIDDINRRIIAEIIAVDEKSDMVSEKLNKAESHRYLRINLIGEICNGSFSFGVTKMPPVFSEIMIISEADLRLMLDINSGEIVDENGKTKLTVLPIGTSVTIIPGNKDADINNDRGVNTTPDTLPISKAISLSFAKMYAPVSLMQFCDTFILPNVNDLFSSKDTIPYSLQRFTEAVEFAVLYEGSINSSRIYEYTSTLITRLKHLSESEQGDFFDKTSFSSIDDYIRDIIGVSQLLNIDISNLDDTATEVVTKVFSKMLFDYLRALSPRNSMPINLILEEAHRFVRSDMDYGVLGYNIFERIAKEGRKFGLLMGISSQRPSELSKTVVSQCNNFIIHKIQNPDDIQYISRMVPYMNQGMVDRITYLRRGYALVFGTAINLPTLTAFEKASPSPNSGNSNIVEKWYVD